MENKGTRPMMPSGIKGILFNIIYKLSNRKKRMDMIRPYFHHLGENVTLYSPSFSSERYLISIEDNVLCASSVKFITHDASVNNNMRLHPEILIDGVGPIVLHENCFVGAYSILMPNTSVGKNSIVAAGSVVTKHIPDNEVLGGVPAKFIMPLDDLIKKRIINSKQLPWLEGNSKLEGNSLVLCREKYYFDDKE